MNVLVIFDWLLTLEQGLVRIGRENGEWLE
jgi:hypothetical protein